MVESLHNISREKIKSLRLFLSLTEIYPVIKASFSTQGYT